MVDIQSFIITLVLVLVQLEHFYLLITSVLNVDLEDSGMEQHALQVVLPHNISILLQENANAHQL